MGEAGEVTVTEMVPQSQSLPSSPPHSTIENKIDNNHNDSNYKPTLNPYFSETNKSNNNNNGGIIVRIGTSIFIPNEKEPQKVPGGNIIRGELGRGIRNGNQLLKAINQRLQLFQDQQQQLQQQQLQYNKQNGNENTNEIDETTTLSNNLKSNIWNVNKYQAYYIYDPIRTIPLVDDVIINNNNNNKTNENTIQTKRRYIERESIDPVLFISTTNVSPNYKPLLSSITTILSIGWIFIYDGGLYTKTEKVNGMIRAYYEAGEHITSLVSTTSASESASSVSASSVSTVMGAVGTTNTNIGTAVWDGTAASQGWENIGMDGSYLTLLFTMLPLTLLLIQV